MWFKESVVWRFRKALESELWVESAFLNKLQVSESLRLSESANWLCGDSYTSCRLLLVFLSGGILSIVTHGFSLPSNIPPKILCFWDWVSHCSPGCPRTLRFLGWFQTRINPPASTCRVVELKVCHLAQHLKSFDCIPWIKVYWLYCDFSQYQRSFTVLPQELVPVSRAYS